MKILVTGNAGSGKSTLARKIGNSRDLPYFGLDTIVYKEKWQKATNDEIKKEIASLIAKKAWVIDGVSYDVMNVADVTVFLDVPRRVAYFRVARRNWRYLFKSRPGLPANCPEILIIPYLIKIIWRFPRRIRPKILDRGVKANAGAFIHIQTKHELDEFLTSLQ